MSRHRRPTRPLATSAGAVDAPSIAPAGPRLAGIDALRGGALCLMFVYHFAFDLRFYRVIAADFEHDPFWLGFRALIVASFMALVGVSLVLADRAGVAPVRFWQRIGVIAACALTVSVASWVMFPRSFIYFGILHGIAVASVLARPLVRRPVLALGIGCAVIAAGFGWSHSVFDAGPLSWIGFVTVKPATEDYVPLAPWAGFVLLGIALGHRLAGDAFRALAPIAAAPAWLQWLGRHSLAVYMAHQPILLGALWLAVGR
jgi:uncharacterized membrane protein